MLQLPSFSQEPERENVLLSGWNLTAVQSLNCFSNFTISILIFPPLALYWPPLICLQLRTLMMRTSYCQFQMSILPGKSFPLINELDEVMTFNWNIKQKMEYSDAIRVK